MANIRIMSVAMAISGAVLLGACGAPHTRTATNSDDPAQRNSNVAAGQNSGSPTHQSSSAPPQQNSANLAQQKFSSGIASYENDNLNAARKDLVNALSLGLHNKQDQVRAHKYLAFIYCASHRKRECRNEFLKALEIDPTFTLSPAEAGHPVWGPVFRAEKAKNQ